MTFCKYLPVLVLLSSDNAALRYAGLLSCNFCTIFSHLLLFVSCILFVCLLCTFCLSPAYFFFLISYFSSNFRLFVCRLLLAKPPGLAAAAELGVRSEFPRALNRPWVPTFTNGGISVGGGRGWGHSTF